MKNYDLKFALLLLTCILFPLAVQAQDSGWGNLKGKILVEGDVPAIPEEVIDKDKTTCISDGKAPLDDNLIVGKSGELRDAFVMMYFKKGDDKRPAIHPDYEAAKEMAVEIDNIKCRFEPHALFVRTGQTFKLKNSDDVGHNCHITCFNNEENVNLAAGSSVDIRLANAEKSPGNITCDIHKWMDAVVLVRDEPYAAITGEDGTFEIKNIPAGTWRFQFWHKKTGYMRKLDVPGNKVGRKGEIEVTIANGETLDLGTLVLPASSIRK